MVGLSYKPSSGQPAVDNCLYHEKKKKKNYKYSGIILVGNHRSDAKGKIAEKAEIFYDHCIGECRLCGVNIRMVMLYFEQKMDEEISSCQLNTAHQHEISY